MAKLWEPAGPPNRGLMVIEHSDGSIEEVGYVSIQVFTRLIELVDESDERSDQEASMDDYDIRNRFDWTAKDGRKGTVLIDPDATRRVFPDADLGDGRTGTIYFGEPGYDLLKSRQAVAKPA